MSETTTAEPKRGKTKRKRQNDAGGEIAPPAESLSLPSPDGLETPRSESCPPDCLTCGGKGIVDGRACGQCHGMGATIDVAVNAQSGEIDPPNLAEIAADMAAAGVGIDPEAEIVGRNAAGEIVARGTVNIETGVFTPTPATAGGEGPRLDMAKAIDAPEMLALYDAETSRLVSEFERQVTDAEAEFESAKNDAKAAKEHFEAQESSLRRLIRQRRDQRGKPQQAELFDGSPADPHDAEGLTGSPDTDVPPDEWAAKQAATRSEEPEDETWKTVPLSSLSLKPGLLKKLAEPIHKERGPIAPITTLGELTAYQEPTATGYCHRLIDIKGIGAGAADEIGEACLQFWNERSRGKGGEA